MLYQNKQNTVQPLYNKSLMNSAYTLNLYIKDTFSGSLECPLYTGLTTQLNINMHVVIIS